MSFVAGLPCIPTFRVPSSQVTSGAKTWQVWELRWVELRFIEGEQTTPAHGFLRYQQTISSTIYACLADNVIGERRTRAGVNYKTFSASWIQKTKRIWTAPHFLIKFGGNQTDMDMIPHPRMVSYWHFGWTITTRPRKGSRFLFSFWLIVQL